MAILTKPTITKGQANEFDLSKSELAAISKVVNDSYFSDQANWSKVVVEYKSAEGNQHKMVTFDASDESPKANFELSEKAKDDWEVQSVKIMDFDGGYLKLVRGDLTVEEFDIALGDVQLPGFSPTLKASSINLTNNNFTIDKIGVNSGVGYHHAYFSKGTNISGGGKYYWEYIATNVGYNLSMFVGFNIVNDEANVTNFMSGSRFNNGRVGVDAGWSQRTTDNLSYKGEGQAIVSDPGTMPDSWTTGQTIMMALDADNSKIYIGINGDWGSADPSNNIGGLSIVITKNILYPGAILPGANDSSSFTIAETPSYLPSGFTHLK